MNDRSKKIEDDQEEKEEKRNDEENVAFLRNILMFKPQNFCLGLNLKMSLKKLPRFEPQNDRQKLPRLRLQKTLKIFSGLNLKKNHKNFD